MPLSSEKNPAFFLIHENPLPQRLQGPPEDATVLSGSPKVSFGWDLCFWRVLSNDHKLCKLWETFLEPGFMTLVLIAFRALFWRVSQPKK